MLDARRTRRMSSMIPQGRRLAAGQLHASIRRVAARHCAQRPALRPPAKAILYSEVSRFKM